MGLFEGGLDWFKGAEKEQGVRVSGDAADRVLGPIKAELEAILSIPEATLRERKPIPELIQNFVVNCSRENLVLKMKTECLMNLFKQATQEGDAERAISLLDEAKEMEEKLKKNHDKLWSALYSQCQNDRDKVWTLDEKEMYVELSVESTIKKYIERRLFQEAKK